MDTAVHKPRTKLDAALFPLVLRLRPTIELTEDQFFDLCQLNRELRIERNAAGELLIMPPTGGGTGRRNSRLTARLDVWAERDGSGVAFDSSTGFRLPNGAVLSPDAAWVRNDRLEAIPADAQERFLPLCPDFVVELRSPSDALKDVQGKMEEYRANGARLGWLLDPGPRRVCVYRPDAPVERLEDPVTVSGDPELPGFLLDLRQVW